MKNLPTYMSVLLVFTALFLVACSKGGANDAESRDKTSAETAEWAETANLDGDESIEELYEKAQEEGEVVVYSATSAVEKIGLAFEEEYPGVKAVVTKVSDVDISEKIQREAESGVRNADLVFGRGTSGSWANELIPDGVLYDYKPNNLTETLGDSYQDLAGMSIISEIVTVLYNTDAYDAPPIDNWWDLTTPEWKSKVLLSDPSSASGTQDLFMAMVKHADEMEAAYEEKFNEKLELNGTENAGYEFIKRLMENDAVLMKSGGDSVDAVAAAKDGDSPVAISSSVKLRDVVNDGATLDIIPELKPKASVEGASKVFMVNEAENVNAAKLFVQFMAGGEDGTGVGFDSFNNPGTFATRSVIEQDNWLPSMEEMNVWEEDETYTYENVDEMRKFLLKIQ